jgi:hypothetical protein
VRPFGFGYRHGVWGGRPLFGRTLWGRRFPAWRQPFYRGRYWAGRRYYSPAAYRRWPWLYRRRYYGYAPPAPAPVSYAP